VVQWLRRLQKKRLSSLSLPRKKSLGFVIYFGDAAFFCVSLAFFIILMWFDVYLLKGEVQADFAFFDPKPDDFHGVKILLQSYLDNTEWDLSGFVDLILEQTTVGTVVKIEDDEDNGLFSVVSALNLGRYKVSSLHFCLSCTQCQWLMSCQLKCGISLWEVCSHYLVRYEASCLFFFVKIPKPESYYGQCLATTSDHLNLKPNMHRCVGNYPLTDFVNVAHSGVNSVLGGCRLFISQQLTSLQICYISTALAKECLALTGS
jgi:hypothetical protein